MAIPTRYRFSGARVRAERKRRQLSLEQLSSMIGVTPPFLGQIELGKRKPSLDTFERLLEVFKERPEALMQPERTNGHFSCERRVMALLHGQPRHRQEAILDSLRFILRRLENGAARVRTP